MVAVEIYTRSLCGYCIAAKRLLTTKGIDFVEHDATFEPDLRAEMIRKSNGASTFPQIFIGGRHIGGCTELLALEHGGALDGLLAGYSPA